MTEREKEIILTTFSHLEKLMNEYRGAVMLLTFGEHDSMNESRKQTTRIRLKELREEINSLLKDIESKTQ